jgi:hypothetical protein
MALTALECPDNVCHCHHGGHVVAREAVERNLNAHGADWCEGLAERNHEISVDSFCQTVIHNLQHMGWQLTFLEDRREDLLDRMAERMAERMLENAEGDFERARGCASADLNEVEHLLLNHAEAQH